MTQQYVLHAIHVLIVLLVHLSFPSGSLVPGPYILDHVTLLLATSLLLHLLLLHLYIKLTISKYHTLGRSLG